MAPTTSSIPAREVMMTEALLPGEFSDLASLVAEWALPTEQERALKRIYTDIGILREFHGRVRPRIEAIIEFLNKHENNPDALPPAVKNLYRLALTFMEVAAPIDLDWKSGDIEDTFPMDRFKFVAIPGRDGVVS
jgi:hypothetical protein